MKIYRSLGAVDADFRPSALTIGNFDGVHLGHRRILRRLAGLAAATGGGALAGLTAAAGGGALAGLAATAGAGAAAAWSFVAAGAGGALPGAGLAAGPGAGGVFSGHLEGNIDYLSGNPIEGARPVGSLQTVGKRFGDENAGSPGQLCQLDDQQADRTTTEYTHRHACLQVCQVDGMDGHTERFEHYSVGFRESRGEREQAFLRPGNKFP